ncbi:hypothetical protein N7456_007264 [Penicillium angulare]|uniref:Xylanolytic transcriptional activator regulatory domain-containing protein n=1 Tax=Penicillium angulare TaxID=116970 RepID=A0A9W9FJQ5_9EURO|nr:hypothetical protein N7456_007264 [Penicillium angulare]
MARLRQESDIGREESQFQDRQDSSRNFQFEELPNLNTPSSSHGSPTCGAPNTSKSPVHSRSVCDQSFTPSDSILPQKSLVDMFEAFLKRQSASKSESPGIVVFGEPSPLTFALEELQHGQRLNIHNASHQNYEDGKSSGLVTQSGHSSAIDLAYLRAKGVFEYPERNISDALVAAYFERFHPLYSIVERSQFEKDYQERSLPWIILHAVCFIGATFCDDAVIHRSEFKSRSEQRHFYYEKAKVLFTVGYHSDKVVLLQSVLMLSFYGPHIQSYWNPGSWTGFGVTIAVSLGLHRAATYAHSHFGEKTRLLRRVWWVLVTREAYTSALLGRSFRLNMSLCDTEPLTYEDFEDIIACSHQRQSDCQCKHPAHYQIEISKLSLILRRILIRRFGPGESTSTVAQIHQLLLDWQSNLPDSINWIQRRSSQCRLSVIFKIMFNYHIILLHMSKPTRVSSAEGEVSCSDAGCSTAIAESAASSIASTAIAVMTTCNLNGFPHEPLPAFFLAGIVFYRQWRQSNAESAESPRASLDNCLIVLNQATDFWDPGNWAVKLFDFLSSTSPDTGGNSGPINHQQIYGANRPESDPNNVFFEGFNSPMVDAQQNNYFSLDTGILLEPNAPEGLGDIMLMPNFWLAAAEDPQLFPI